MPGAAILRKDPRLPHRRPPFMPSILVYVVEHHPLDRPETGPLFRWIHLDRDLSPQLDTDAMRGAKSANMKGRTGLARLRRLFEGNAGFAIGTNPRIYRVIGSHD